MREETNLDGVKMQKRQYVGKTLDDALDQAAEELRTERENLSYNILPTEPGSGFFKKLFQKSIRVEAWVEHTQDLQEAARNAVREAIEGNSGQRSRGKSRQHAASDTTRTDQNRQTNRSTRTGERERNSQPSKTQNQKPNNKTERREPRPRESNPGDENPNAITFDADGVHDLLQKYTEKFLQVFEAQLEHAQFERTETGDMRVSVQSAALEDLLSRSDRLAGSFEHVFKRIVQNKIGDLPQRLLLDAGNATESRIENLKEMARSMAEKVKATGRSITVNSKSGQERRIIHLTIDEIPGVATRSIGTGDNRKLVIYSTEKGKRKRSSRRSTGSPGKRRPVDGAAHAPEASAESADFSEGYQERDPMESVGAAGSDQGQPSAKPRRPRRPRHRRSSRNRSEEGAPQPDASETNS
jgi:spoIIIJ-associated protein